MIPAIGAISAYIDTEYQRILEELRRLGIVPSGNKVIDKIKLSQAKKEKEEKFALEQEELKTISPEREKMEEEKLGATLLGNVNRLLLGI